MKQDMSIYPKHCGNPKCRKYYKRNLKACPFCESEETTTESPFWAIDDIDLATGLVRLEVATNKCPLCEQPMIHYRLLGYQCHNLEHGQILNNIYSRAYNTKSPDKTIQRLIAEWRKEYGYDNA